MFAKVWKLLVSRTIAPSSTALLGMRRLGLFIDPVWCYKIVFRVVDIYMKEFFFFS